jgi:pimeloyl-ACP methyl ester carboxylesterase
MLRLQHLSKRFLAALILASTLIAAAPAQQTSPIPYGNNPSAGKFYDIKLHNLQAPSLIICGDHDLISITHTVLIYQNIPHAQLWVVPNSGHGTLIEHTDDFNHQVDNFFTEPYKDFR